jgi:ABC-type cobalamin transport system permease subunit
MKRTIGVSLAVLATASVLTGCATSEPTESEDTSKPVVCADIVGRTAIAPIQLPATLLTSCIGAPYFFWLMYRSRRVRATMA